jgi:hypothetical protein
MAYIGQQPFQEFASIPTKDSFTGDGSTTTFDLANDVVRGGENALEVFVNNVRQEPGSGKAFALGVDGSSNYRRITFTAAPADGASIYVINDKTNLSTIAPLNTDFNGVELVLDADADTSLHAETDDQIDLRIAGVDVAKFLQSSGDLVIKPMVDAKDIIFQQYDGNILLTIDDAGFVGIHNSAAGPGELRIYEDTDLGSNYVGFKAPNVTTSISYVLPVADGSANTQLTTNGSGVLSWTANTLSLANDANNRIITGTGSGLNGEANLTFDGSTLAVTGAITGSGDLTLQDDLILDSDAAVLSFGDDQDVTLTHVADTGLLLNSTMKLQFNDASQFIHAPSATVLDIAATDEIELTATLIDVVGNLTTSGTIVSTGTITGTLATAAQGNITSLGTLTALTVDDVAIDGKVVTMTGSTGDTFVTTVGTNGATSLVTTDAGGATAHLQITADGTVDIDSAGVLTLDSGGVLVLDSGDNDFQFKYGGGHTLSIINSNGSSAFRPMVDGKDLLFQQYDGNSVLTVEDDFTVKVTTAGKFKYVDTYVTATGAELNYSDLVTLGTTAASKVFTADANNLTKVSGAVLNIEDTLTDGATVAWNVVNSPVAKLTMGGNRTLSAPSGTTPASGQFISLLLIQDGTGSRTITWNAVYEFTADTAPTLTTTANLGDLFVFRYNGAKWLEVGRNLNLVLS